MSTESSRSEIYVLQRNTIASTRLNLQHYIWHRALGYNIHPSIDVPAKALVCDVATGTGLWLLEVAEEHANAQCDGFDISLVQAPPPAWSPPNVSFRQWGMMSDVLPAAMEGAYDFVHVRLVTLAIEDDADPLVRNLWKLLKPGGWLQWDEADFAARTLLESKNGVEAQDSLDETPMGKMSSMMLERSGKDWFTKMPDLLSKHGFEGTTRFSVGSEKSMLKFETDCHILVWDEILATMEDERKPMLQELVEGVKMQASHGGGLAFGKTATVAKKPDT